MKRGSHCNIGLRAILPWFGTKINVLRGNRKDRILAENYRQIFFFLIYFVVTFVFAFNFSRDVFMLSSEERMDNDFVSHGRQQEVECFLFWRGFVPHHGRILF